MGKRLFVWRCSFSFIIFVTHRPAAPLAINGVFALLHHTHGYRIITYVALPIIKIAFCVGFDEVLRRLLPKLYSAITRGRGHWITGSDKEWLFDKPGECDESNQKMEEEG